MSSQDVTDLLPQEAPVPENNDTVNANATSRPVMNCVPLQLTQILTCTETISPHNLFDLFDRAFVSLPAASPASSAVICIYNIGLTHHTQAMLLTDNSTYHFHRAQHFYNLAREALNGPLDQEESLRLVKLALLNNIGHISSHFWDREGVTTAIQGIFDTLPDFLHEAVNICDPDVLFFYSYRCHEHVPSLNQAPAAWRSDESLLR